MKRSFVITELLKKKRDGGTLDAEELEWLIRNYVKGAIPDYQMSAFLMAVYFRGMSSDELLNFVRIMRDSGAKLDLSRVPGFHLDKHSTGGVGDKISLVLAPVLASLGLSVPMISGRGLGHSGGTLDKLEAIPGLKTRIPVQRFVEILSQVGFVIAGQTEDMVPADKKLYALRDATATVDSIPLVVGSILSKKLAEDLDGLILDVKTGKGAFFPKKKDAVQLARILVEIATEFGVITRALLTSMDQPVGYAVGNWLEVVETVDCLTNQGPEDTMELVEALAVLALQVSGDRHPLNHQLARIRKAISSGEAFDRFLRYVSLMGGDPAILEHPERFPLPKPVVYTAPREGYIEDLDAYRIGMAAFYAGAGRLKVEDPVDAVAGIRLHKKNGRLGSAG